MKTVIFDFDGTLADSLGVVTAVFEQLTGKAVQQLSPREMAELRHLPLLAVAEKLGVPRWQFPYLVWRGRQLLTPRIAGLEPFAGVPAALKALHEQGFKLLLVSSNSVHNVRHFLRLHGLDTYFAHVYGGVGLFSKTAALRRILRRNRLQLTDCVYVGDETRDIEACQALGLRVIAVEWGFADPRFLAEHQPTALVKTPQDLEAAIVESLQT